MLITLFLSGGVLGSSLIHDKQLEPSASFQDEFYGLDSVNAVCFLTSAEVISADNVTPLLATPVFSSTKEPTPGDNELFLPQPKLTFIQKMRINGACCWQHATCQTFEYCDDWAIKKAIENRVGPRCNRCLPSCSIDCTEVRKKAWNCCVKTNDFCLFCAQECAKLPAPEQHCNHCHNHYHRFDIPKDFNHHPSHRSSVNVKFDVNQTF